MTETFVGPASTRSFSVVTFTMLGYGRAACCGSGNSSGTISCKFTTTISDNISNSSNTPCPKYPHSPEPPPTHASRHPNLMRLLTTPNIPGPISLLTPPPIQTLPVYIYCRLLFRSPKKSSSWVNIPLKKGIRLPNPSITTTPQGRIKEYVMDEASVSPDIKRICTA